MTVSEYIEWLKTMPQSAKVTVLSHQNGHGYYDQGGNCFIEDFHNTVEWAGENSSAEKYIYGLHFELTTYKGEYELQIGVKDK